MRRMVRQAAFRLARPDILKFIEDNEKDLRQIFREELHRLDERLPEEEIFVDIHMVALGDELMTAALEAIKRFLREY